jgi:hypothetical protein
MTTTAATSSAAHIASTTGTTEAMTAPAVAIAPVGPWTHSQEDAVIEITRSIKTVGRTGIGCIVVVAVGTDWRNT